MARNTLQAVYARDIIDLVDGTALSVASSLLTTAAIANNKFIHTGLINFADVYLEDDRNSFTQLKQFKITEYATTLGLPAIQVYLFNECDILATAGDTFAFTANTTRNNVIYTFSLASTDYHTFPDGKSAMYIKTIDPTILAKAYSSVRYIKCIAVSLGTNTLGTNCVINTQLGIIGG